jgi:thioredoxin 1
MKQLKLLTASWCGPCHALKNRLEKQNISVDLVDIDQEKELVQKYSVRSVPTLLVIDGESCEKVNGSEEIVAKILANSNN